MYQNLYVHVSGIHKDHLEVKRVLTMNVNNEDGSKNKIRSEAFNKLTMAGNYRHNQQVFENREGILIPLRTYPENYASEG